MPRKPCTAPARTEFGKRAPVEHVVRHAPSKEVAELVACPDHDNCNYLDVATGGNPTIFKNRRLAERAVARTVEHFEDLAGTFEIREVH